MHSHISKSQIHQNNSLSQIQNQRTKGSQIPNTNCAQTKKRVIKQIQKLQRTKREQITISQNQNLAVTDLSYYSKLQLTNIKEPNKREPVFPTILSSLSL